MPQIPHADEGSTCPLHKVDVSKVCHKCAWWTRILGKNPQSEEPVDHWQCAIAMLPMLLIENAQMTRQGNAAIESMRNETVNGIMRNTAMMLQQQQVERRIADAGRDRS